VEIKDLGHSSSSGEFIDIKSKKQGLFAANPMLGRPTPDTVTLTVKAGMAPISLRLKICREASDKQGCDAEPTVPTSPSFLNRPNPSFEMNFAYLILKRWFLGGKRI